MRCSDGLRKKKRRLRGADGVVLAIDDERARLPYRYADSPAQIWDAIAPSLA